VLETLKASGEPDAVRVGTLRARADGEEVVTVHKTATWGWAA